MITNAGWKAVAINPTTAENDPQTLSVDSITVASPTNSSNTLVLNYSGFGTPLTTRSLRIEPNAAFVALASALQITLDFGADTFVISGTFMQGASAQIHADGVLVGDSGPAVCYMTNGTFSADGLQVGGVFTGEFYQFGGTNSQGGLGIQSGSAYTLYDGSFTGSILVTYGSFVQLGGIVSSSDVNLVRGAYTLSNGVFTAANVALPGNEWDVNGPSYFVQAGGTNILASSLSIGPVAGAFGLSPGTYTLSDGVLTLPAMVVGPFGNFTQSDGQAVMNGSISVQGYELHLGEWFGGALSLTGGQLGSTGLSVSTGSFSQSGGTDTVTGDLAMGPSPSQWSFRLSGGLLRTANSTFQQGGTLGTFSGGAAQSGGTHLINNLLHISGTNATFNRYLFSGGTLSADAMEIDSGATFQQTGGTINVPGLITLANGTWLCNTGEHQVGALMLGVSGGSNSCLVMPAGPSILRFANNSLAMWATQALLIIENWQGSLQGGGAHQVLVGASGQALTPQQISQVRFLNPLGVPGLFSACFPHGELLPKLLLAPERNGGNLVLSWANGDSLQSATNVSGPHADVSVTSPYAVPLTDPSRFFRLRETVSFP